MSSESETFSDPADPASDEDKVVRPPAEETRGGFGPRFGMAYDVLYDNIGSLAVPPQVGSTIDVPSVVNRTAVETKGLGLVVRDSRFAPCASSFV